MRSVAVLLLAAAGFGGFLHAMHRRAGDLAAAEEAALAQLRLLAVRGAGPEQVRGGYRFAWERREGLPPLLVARPVREGEDGVRWFATTGDAVVYEFDTVLFGTRDDGPDPRLLHSYLAAPPRESPPPGWTRVE